MFINLETDPHIPSLLSLSRLCESSSSNSIRTSAHVRARTLLGLPLTSALGRYSDSCSLPRSDSTWNPALVVLSIHLRTPTHVRTRTLLGLPFTSALGRYSDSCSLPHSDSTRSPTLVVLSICLPAIPYSRIPTSLGAPCLSALRVLGTPLGHSAQASARASVSQFILQVRARTFGPRSDLCPHPRYSCIYKSEPTPSDPVRTSVLVRVTI
jgi:hypothetical protein